MVVNQLVLIIGNTCVPACPNLVSPLATVTKMSDGSQFFEYCCLYVDDTLVISDDPEKIIRDEIGRHWELKKGSVGPPNVYLGNKVSKVTLSNNTKMSKRS